MSVQGGVQDCQASWVDVLMAMYSDAVPCRITTCILEGM